ncbi:MAG: hypothetical protein IPK64_13380 [bacterium]|nr:hypothetical protein [bacterium]
MIRESNCSRPLRSVSRRLSFTCLLLLSIVTAPACADPDQPLAAVESPAPPTSVVKLIFIHHSTGANWLADGHGNLGVALAYNNYFVSDTNYGWGPGGIGNRTDIPDWLEWFRGAQTPTIMAALNAESRQHCTYTRTVPDPGGPNAIIVFKSCFPNSALQGSASDPPSPVVGLTVGHAKFVYNQLLLHFQAHPEQLFVVITAPPLSDPTHAANARAFNRWLVDDWLNTNGYTLRNVAVFDFYNVLTSNGGNADTNDLGSALGNHHRWRNGSVEHMTDGGADVLAYPTGDDHPSPAGNRKATGEFVPLLNLFYHRWLDGGATAVEEPRPSTRASRLVGIAPNPFNPQTTIRYALPVGGPARLAVFDVAGRLIRTLVDGTMPEGGHEVTWDGRDAVGREVPSGSYLARLEFGGKAEVARMGLVR